MNNSTETGAPTAGDVWEGNDNSAVRVVGVNGEMIHYEMRDRITGAWIWYPALPLPYFNGWARAHKAKKVAYRTTGTG